MNIETLICAEVDRLSKKYNKDYLELKEVMEITGLGRDKVREIFNSSNFPLSTYGHKKTVSIMSFVIWHKRRFLWQRRKNKDEQIMMVASSI